MIKGLTDSIYQKEVPKRQKTFIINLFIKNIIILARVFCKYSLQEFLSNCSTIIGETVQGYPVRKSVRISCKE